MKQKNQELTGKVTDLEDKLNTAAQTGVPPNGEGQEPKTQAEQDLQNKVDELKEQYKESVERMHLAEKKAAESRRMYMAAKKHYEEQAWLHAKQINDGR